MSNNTFTFMTRIGDLLEGGKDIAPNISKKDLIIFLDTNLINPKNNERLESLFAEVLKHNEQTIDKRIEIFISQITYEEKRTQIRDGKLRTYRSNIAKPIPEIILNQYEKESHENIREIFPSNTVLINLDFPHFKRSVDNYFAWKGCFNRNFDLYISRKFKPGCKECGQVKDKDKPPNRKANIPDALIFEAVCSLRDILKIDPSNIYFISEDDTFRDTVSKEGFNTFKSAEGEMWENIHNKGGQSIPPTSSGSQSISIQSDISLRDRICGYLDYVAPETKELLIQFLSRHSHGITEIENEIDALIKEGLLQRTHDGRYIPVHDKKNLYEQAAKKITPEILQYMEENADE